MLTNALIAIAVIVVVCAVAVAVQPSEFRIARTASVTAHAPAVFAQVNDFRNWEGGPPGRNAIR